MRLIIIEGDGILLDNVLAKARVAPFNHRKKSAVHCLSYASHISTE